jgi:hypothetical protein
MVRASESTSIPPLSADEPTMSTHDVEVRHHPGGVVLQDMAVVHPPARAVVGHPRDPHAPLCGNVHGVLPGEQRGRNRFGERKIVAATSSSDTAFKPPADVTTVFSCIGKAVSSGRSAALRDVRSRSTYYI